MSAVNKMSMLPSPHPGKPGLCCLSCLSFSTVFPSLAVPDRAPKVKGETVLLLLLLPAMAPVLLEDPWIPLYLSRSFLFALYSFLPFQVSFPTSQSVFRFIHSMFSINPPLQSWTSLDSMMRVLGQTNSRRMNDNIASETHQELAILSGDGRNLPIKQVYE